MHARGLRPRRTSEHLALAMPRVLPSATIESVGVLEGFFFAAQYPACMCPCQRFDAAFADGSA